MEQINLPILYSFRRCPYAMRARLAIAQSKQIVELREIVLRKKPEELLNISPKGTVPVLQCSNEIVLEESYEIMIWALQQNDTDNWLRTITLPSHEKLLTENDTTFKKNLDTYKYANRHPEKTEEEHRKQGETFLQKLESLLTKQPFLIDNEPSITDVAIFPFIRQFTRVDAEWFLQANYPNLKKWLDFFYQSEIQEISMKKYKTWEKSKEIALFPPQNIDKNA